MLWFSVFAGIAHSYVSRYRPLILDAPDAVRVAVREHEDLDDWISEDGPLVLIGEAAHPFPVSSIISPSCHARH